MFRILFRRPPSADQVRAVYDTVVRAARAPVFYRDYGIPDTVDGRFELLVLHMFLVLRRLKGAQQPAPRLSQRLFDTMFDDMDIALREMGAGDMGVGKRVKAMAQAFYGRVAAYETALSHGEESFSRALERNLYATVGGESENVDKLVRYFRKQEEYLRDVSVETIVSAEFSLPEPTE